MGYAGTIGAELVRDRSAFLTKVYGLFMASLVVGAAGGYAACVTPSLLSVAANGWFFLVGFALLFAAVACRKMPVVNVGMLFLFTFVEGMWVGPRAAYYSLAATGGFDILFQAAGITGGAFLALTLYVYIARENFTWLGGFLWPALLGMLLTGLLNIFWPMGSSAYTIFCYLGVLLFIGFILYDTSNIATRYPDDEYVAGAIDLFMDFVNMFLYILQILGGSRSKD